MVNIQNTLYLLYYCPQRPNMHYHYIGNHGQGIHWWYKIWPLTFHSRSSVTFKVNLIQNMLYLLYYYSPLGPQWGIIILLLSVRPSVRPKTIIKRHFYLLLTVLNKLLSSDDLLPVETQYVLPSFRKSWSGNQLVILDLASDLLFKVICYFHGQS